MKINWKHKIGFYDNKPESLDEAPTFFNHNDKGFLYNIYVLHKLGNRFNKRCNAEKER